MADGFFSVTFNRAGSDSSETIPAKIRLQKVDKPNDKQAHLVKVPFVKTDLAGAPSAATCHLQIWEVDFFRTTRWLSDDETDTAPPENQVLATVPGVVIQDGGKYRFVATGSIKALNSDSKQIGFVTIELDEQSTKASNAVKVPLREYEGVVELAATLSLSDSDRALANNGEVQPFQVHNVVASVEQQVKTRGGIAVAFIADYKPFKKSNDEEFERLGSSMIDRMPTFAVKNGKLRFGFHVIKHINEMPAIVDSVRAQAQADAALTGKPKIAVLPIYGHGVAEAISINQRGYDAPGSLNFRRKKGTTLVSSAHDFVTDLKAHLTDDVVIPLFACSAGKRKRGTESLGAQLPGNELGGDSLAWGLLHELRKQGIPRPTIWAHLTAAHSTRNPALRLYSDSGCVDFPNLLHQRRQLDGAARKAYTQSFPNAGPPGDAKFAERLRRLNLIATISLQPAGSFDFRFMGGEGPTGATAEMRKETERLLKLVATGLTQPAEITSSLVFDTGFSRVLGLLTPAPNAQISEDFSLH